MTVHRSSRTHGPTPPGTSHCDRGAWGGGGRPSAALRPGILTVQPITISMDLSPLLTHEHASTTEHSEHNGAREHAISELTHCISAKNRPDFS